MTDSILANAIMRRDAARAEVERWDSFIRSYNELAGNPLTVQRFDARTSSQASASTGGVIGQTERAAAKIIRDAGRPLHTGELLKRLSEIGLQVGGSNPMATLSARLSRAESLENVRPIGWRLKKMTADGKQNDAQSAVINNTQQDREAGPGGGT